MMAASDKLSVALNELLGMPASRLERNPNIKDITVDSREVMPGSLFLACAGREHHGLEFVDQALRSGAVAVVWESAPGVTSPRLPSHVISLEVPELRHRLGRMASQFFGAPSEKLEVTGITGTNGKTTCAWLLASALDATGQSAGVIGTLGHGFPMALSAGDLTTPDCISVHRRLAELRGLGASRVAMEVSSHALDQGRVDGVRITTAMFTNLSRDHLDYHGDLASYGAAKARLFLNPELERAIVNVDDSWSATIIEQIAHRTDLVEVGHAASAKRGGSFLQLVDVTPLQRGQRLRFDGTWGELRVDSPLLGGFNASNIALVLAQLLSEGIPANDLADILSKLSAPPGRMEAVTDSPEQPLAIVDYAHTPDALEKALSALRAHGSGRLWCVFGCGGDRDTGKRAMMGEIARRLADEVIVTSDNPRSEDPDAIASQILSSDSNATNQANVFIEHDRREAIRMALESAAPDDIVLIAGKGHEPYQEIGGERLPFSDNREILRILESTP